jgi:sec-independent protein translocase protein TatA
MPIGGLGMGEIILIFLVVLLLFGAKRLPEVGSALGKGIREFKSSVREIEGELKAPLDDKKKVSSPRSQAGDVGPRRLATSDEERTETKQLAASDEESGEPKRLSTTDEEERQS